MKQISKYIQIIISLSSFALLGFLIIQFYWAKNTFNEKKQNLNRVFDICVQEIGHELNHVVLKKATPNNPILSPKLPSFGRNNIEDQKKEIIDSIYQEIKSLKKKSLAEKRKGVLKIINTHFLLNLNYNIEQILKNGDVIEIIENTLEIHGIDNNFNYTITDEKGGLILTDFEDIDNVSLTKYSSYSSAFLEDNLSAQEKTLTLYIKGLEKSIIKSISHIFIISILLMLIITGTFIYSIRVIKNQKKNTQIKTDFINNMTHELKTPIATIGLACEALTDQSVNLEKINQDKFLNTIQNENIRLGKLVENVLQSSVSEKGNPDLKLEVLNIEEIIGKAIKSIQISFNKRDGNITTDFIAENKLIEADKLHITSVIQNLLDNSLKYTPKKPLVKISTRDIIGGVVIRIKDNGMGIAKENHKRIFEKLYRVPTGNIHNVKGFGLGLSYVKSIVDLHNGSIKVESKLDNGSTFLITLKSSKII